MSSIKKFLIASCLFLVIFILSASEINAAVTKPSFSVKIRKDRKAITVYFNYLNTAKSVSYELTYVGNGLQQGVVGSIYPKEGNSSSRLLLFGTCSKNVCTYHKNIKNAQLAIKYKPKTGNKTYIKRYKIKI